MTTARDQEQIRALTESWAAALRAKDVDRVMAHCAPDLIVFDLAPPLQHDADAARQGLAEWFPTWVGPIGYEITALDVTVGGDVAFARSLNHLHGKRTGGETSDVWFRATLGLRRSDGRWLVVHEHTSVPFYMDGSFKAAVDLKP